MEIKSTLEKTKEEWLNRRKEVEEATKDRQPELTNIFNLVERSESAKWLVRSAVTVASTIQPSIMEEDLRIAVVMQCAQATQLVYNLVEEGLITIVKKRLKK